MLPGGFPAPQSAACIAVTGLQIVPLKSGSSLMVLYFHAEDLVVSSVFLKLFQHF